MTIGLDFDGVIINWSLLKKDSLRLFYGHLLPAEEIFKESCVKKSLFSSSEYDAFIYRIWTDPGSLAVMQEVSGASKHIHMLTKTHTLSIVTARPIESEPIIKTWLSNNNLDLPIIHANKTSSTTWATPFECIVDDDYRVLKNLTNQTNYLFLFSWWYNIHEALKPPCQRITTWEELKRNLSL